MTVVIPPKHLQNPIWGFTCTKNAYLYLESTHSSSSASVDYLNVIKDSGSKTGLGCPWMHLR